jgi:hypothetical protein
MLFPGFDTFEPTAPFLHAIFLLREAIPADCGSIKVEFSDMGAALATASRRDGGFRSVTLSDDTMAAAGMLLSFLSYQVITLSGMMKPQGDDAVEATLAQLSESIAKAGLSVGYLEKACDDSVTVRAGIPAPPRS